MTVLFLLRYAFSVFFLLQISAIGQMRAHLRNCVHIWSLLVGLIKCAAHLGKSAAHARLERACDLPNVAKLVNAARLTNWSNALRDYANAQIGQMRLTVTQYSFLIP